MAAVRNTNTYAPTTLSVVELQKELGIGRDLAYSLVKRKDFPSIKIGREYRVLADNLYDWVMKQQKNK